MTRGLTAGSNLPGAVSRVIGIFVVLFSMLAATATPANAIGEIVGPAVTSISPNSGTTDGGTTVTITGTNFAGTFLVLFGATQATSYTVDSSTQITAVSPAHFAGVVDVRVNTAAGASPISQNDQFTFVAPTPTVTSISPSSGPTTGGTSVTITGTHLNSVLEVLFGNADATSFAHVSDTQITAVAPAHAAGTVDITLFSPQGTSATSAADQFTFITPAPTVTAVSPSSGTTAGGTSVTITGTNFASASAVKFGTTAATTFTVNSATQITVTAPAGAAGTVDI
ncbi:MAG: IPT/TIG domain-containing protein, partial [Alphaproteobacteria bacterium]|nr:IPT/TIG domain-containing protein [Alphaproteobacteria bacterium]